jgi:hypothetical protein
MKTCYTCKLPKDDSEFHNDKNRCESCLKAYRKNYHIKNKEKVHAQQKEYYENNKDAVLNYQKGYYYSNVGKINSIFNTANRRAKKKNIPFDLTKEWIIFKLEEQNYCCALTHIQLVVEQTENYLNPYMPSLDRIDSTKGYTKDNVRIVCAAINLALNEYGEEVFGQICKAYLALANSDKNHS